MIDVIDNKYFYLHNGAVAYLFGLLPNHQLEHLYYGEDLGELSKNDLVNLITRILLRGG